MSGMLSVRELDWESNLCTCACSPLSLIEFESITSVLCPLEINRLQSFGTLEEFTAEAIRGVVREMAARPSYSDVFGCMRDVEPPRGPGSA